MIVVLWGTYIVRKVVITPGGVMKTYNVTVEYVRQQHAPKAISMTLVSGCFSNHVGEAKRLADYSGMDVGVGRTEHSPPSVGLSNWISQCVKRASMGVNSTTSIRGQWWIPEVYGCQRIRGSHQ